MTSSYHGVRIGGATIWQICCKEYVIALIKYKTHITKYICTIWIIIMIFKTNNLIVLLLL